MNESLLKTIKPVLDRAMKRARDRGAGAAKVAYMQTESIGTTIENARLKSTETSQSLTYEIDVILDDEGFDPGQRRRRPGRPGQPRGIPGAGGSVAHFRGVSRAASFKRVRMHSEVSALGLTRERLIDAGNGHLKGLDASDKELFISAGAARNESEGLVITTGGLSHEWKTTSWWLSGSIHRVRGTDMLFATREGIGATSTGISAPNSSRNG